MGRDWRAKESAQNAPSPSCVLQYNIRGLAPVKTGKPTHPSGGGPPHTLHVQRLAWSCRVNTSTDILHPWPVARALPGCQGAPPTSAGEGGQQALATHGTCRKGGAGVYPGLELYLFFTQVCSLYSHSHRTRSLTCSSAKHASPTLSFSQVCSRVSMRLQYFET